MERGTIASVERSDSHEELRWVRLEGYEYPFSLWDSVYDGALEEGQVIEFEGSPVEGRNFVKITQLKVPGRKKGKAHPTPASDPERFSKTEIGLMASVALKVAGTLVAAQLTGTKARLNTDKLFALADGIYEWLCIKRVKELQAQAEPEDE
jgi:hypothetical protein